ncbi:MAG: hypothetical protein LBF67_06325 [Prevotellaceae bacterium]|jgi:tetratricopeptide (TPR) repeat protein|nr:hypothetical protein [Prevotellaceae bacterium]
MKTQFILLTLALLCLQPLAAQEDYGQNVVDGLYMRQYADVLDYYDRHKDSIAGLPLLVYKAITSVALNKPDSAIAYLNILLNDAYPDSSGGGAIAEDWFYDRLIRMYRYRGDYENAAKCYERLAARLAVRPYNTDSYAEYLRVLNNRSQQESLFSTMTLLNTGETEDIRIKMQIAKHMIIPEAQYNKTLLKIKTCFDTGFQDGYFVMGRRTADSIGVKKVVVADSMPINGDKMSSFRGVIDSIRMGNLLIRNAPVLVMLADTTPLDYDADDSTFTPRVVMGLPVIKRLNHIRLDMRNEEMVISLNRKDAATGKSNMFLDNANIYEKLLLTGRLNGARFTAFFDTGWWGTKDSLAILVTKDFYQNYKEAFPNLEDNSVDSTTIRLLNNNSKINHIRVPESQLQIDGKLLTFHRDVVVLQDSYNVLVKSLIKDDGGLIGLIPLQRFNKVTLDFYNMRLEVE